MNKLAFYYDSLEIPLDNTIEELKNYLYSQHSYEDFIIFTNVMFATNIKNSMLPTFYASFFDGTIIFFDSSDYDAFVHTNKWLYVNNPDEFKKANHGSKYNFIVHDHDDNTQKYRMIKYDKLQPII